MKVFILCGWERHQDDTLEVFYTEKEALERGEKLLKQWCDHYESKKKIEWAKLGRDGNTFIHHFSFGDDGPSIRIDRFDLKRGI